MTAAASRTSVDPRFDVERFRGVGERLAVVRRVDRPTVVLGSRQRDEVLDPARVAALGVEVVRRRSGGGAVLLEPGDPLWLDVWVPRGDPLWRDDVIEATAWVGEWWAAGLASLGAEGLVVHRGRSLPSRWADQVCFAGTGPGEVLAGVGGPKVVGLCQWRGRQGALFQTAAYHRWAPGLLVEVVAVDGAVRAELARDLAAAAVGAAELLPVGQPGALLAAAIAALPGSGWRIEDPTP